jgi:chromosome segregation ATPase
LSSHSEQRDRAEGEKIEERELHEREIAEYKMKLHSFESEVDKLTTRLHRALADKDRLETRIESGDLSKARGGLERERERERERELYERRAGEREFDATLNQKIQRLEIENDRLRAELERSQVSWMCVGIMVF